MKETVAFMQNVDAGGLNDVDVHTPIGVVRLGADLTIIWANSGYASLLRAEADEIAGTSIARYFPPDEMARVNSQLHRVFNGSVDALVSDSLALRTDLSTI